MSERPYGFEPGVGLRCAEKRCEQSVYAASGTDRRRCSPSAIELTMSA
jgi:hypothetical protein